MELKFEEILKNIFPGILILGCLFLLTSKNIPFYDSIGSDLDSWKNFSELFVIGILILSYFVGYINDMIASFIERGPLFWIFARPSYNLLKDRTLKIKLYDRENIFTCLKNLTNDIHSTNCDNLTRRDAKKIFQKAKELTEQHAEGINLSKYHSFYKSYNFSRNILIAAVFILIGFSVFNPSIPADWRSIKIVLGILILLFLVRWLQNGLYYSRLILTVANNNANPLQDNLRESKITLHKATEESIKAEAAALRSELSAGKLNELANKLEHLLAEIKK